MEDNASTDFSENSKEVLSKRKKRISWWEQKSEYLNIPPAARRSIYLYSGIYFIIAAVALILIALMPISTSTGYNLGNIYTLFFEIISFPKGISEYENVKEYISLAWPLYTVCAAFVLLSAIILIRGIYFLKNAFTGSKNEKILAMPKSVVSSYVIFILCAVSSFFAVKIMERYYLFQAPTFIFMVIIVFSVFPVVNTVGHIICKQRSDVFDINNGMYETLRKSKQVCQTPGGLKERGLFSFLYFFIILLACIICFAMNGYSIEGFGINYTPMQFEAKGYYEFGRNVGTYDRLKYVTVSNERGDVIKTFYFTPERFETDGSLSDREIKYFYECRLSALKYDRDRLEIKELDKDTGLDDASEALEAYLKKYDALTEEMEELNEYIDSIPTYEESFKCKKVTVYADYGPFYPASEDYCYFTEYIFDTKLSDKSVHKFGSGSYENENHFFKADESVSVKMCVSSFGSKTTLRSAIATINYADGSVKICDISDEINLKSYESGTYTVRWSDEWGNYEAELVIN